MKRVMVKTALWATAIAGLGCSDIVVKVKKKPSNSTTQSADVTMQKDSSTLDAENVYDFLKEQDNMKDVAAVALIDQLRTDNFRKKFRTAVRDLRQSIIRNAETEHDYGNPVLDAIDNIQCSDLANDRLSHITDHGALGTVLKGSLLSKLSEQAAISLDLDQLDTETLKVISLVLFDMGVTFTSIDGEVISDNGIAPEVTVDGDSRTISQGVLMKVATETGEEAEFGEADKKEISLKYNRINKAGKPSAVELLAEVGQDLLKKDNSITEAISFLKMNIQTTEGGYGKQIVWTLENGSKDRNTASENLVYSRKIIFKQNIQDSKKYEILDTIRHKMIGETTRTSEIDFAELESCVNSNTNDQSGDDSNDQKGDDSNDQSGDDSNDQKGDDSNDQSGDDSNDQKGDDSNDQSGDDSNDQSGDDSNGQKGDYGNDDDTNNDNPGQNNPNQNK